jgi:hypothetical protein
VLHRMAARRDCSGSIPRRRPSSACSPSSPGQLGIPNVTARLQGRESACQQRRPRNGVRCGASFVPHGWRRCYTSYLSGTIAPPRP